MFHAPLISYGEFDWYDISAACLDGLHIDVVVCDGPPGATRGGRVGLPYALGNQLAPGCMIYFDDTHRKGEQEILRKWAKDFELEPVGGSMSGHFLVLSLTQNKLDNFGVANSERAT